MDKLEQFIFDNREAFDVHEPGPEVWARIKSSGSGENKKTKVIRMNWRSFLWRVAAIIVIFSSAYMLSNYVHSLKDKQVATATTGESTEHTGEPEIVIPELVEAEAYYTMELNSKMSELRQHTDNFQEVEEQLNYDFQELDSIYAELENDLKDNICNKEVIDAMIQNYRLKLEILENLLQHLERQENANSDFNTHNQDEDTEIYAL